MFNTIDVNRSGEIDARELKKVIIASGHEGSNAHIREIFSRLDGDNRKFIKFPEYLEMLTSTMILGNDLVQFKRFVKDQVVREEFVSFIVQYIYRERTTHHCSNLEHLLDSNSRLSAVLIKPP